VSQLLQAHGIQVGMEAHRRHRDRCMGSLYWQLNDCWPVASWSSIDYYGKWKALQYTAKKAFKNLLISTENTKDSIHFFVVSDLLENTSANLQISLLDFNGTILKQWQQPIVVEANTSKKYYSLDKNNALNEVDSNNIVLHAELISETDTKTLSENMFYLSPYKNLSFPEPELTYAIKEHYNYFEVILNTKKLAKNVYLSSDSNFNFSDNYFDMLPNTQKVVTIKKTTFDNLNSFKNRLKIMTLIDTYKN